MKNGIYIRKNSKSKLNIKLSYFYLRMLLYIFLTIITFGLLFPYSYTKYCELIFNNTYIDNRKVIFKGTILSAYKTYFKNVIYAFIVIIVFYNLQKETQSLIQFITDYVTTFFSPTIIRFIRSLPAIATVYFLVIKLYKWKLNNIYFLSRADEYTFNQKTKLEYFFKRFIFFYLLSKILFILTASVSYPFSFFCKTKYNYERLKIDNFSLEFLKLKYIIYTFIIILPLYGLSIITIGLASPILMYYGNQYLITNLHIKEK